MLIRTFFAAISLLSSATAHAYADADRTSLWETVSAADTILLVRIDGTYVPEDRGDRIARADVIETWKGRSPSTVQFPRDPTWTDVRYGHQKSAFAREADQPTAIVFMRTAPKGGASTPLASWGLIELSARDFAAWRSAIQAAVALQKVTPSNDARLEWLVQAIASRAVRGHALIGFVPDDAWLNAPGREWQNPFSEQQRAVIAAAFVTEPTNDETFPKVLLLVGQVPNPSFDRIVADVADELILRDRPVDAGPLPADMVKLMNLENPPYWAGATYALVLARLGVDASVRLATWPKNGSSLFPSTSQLRKDWARLKTERALATTKTTAGPSMVDRTWIHLPD